MKRQSYRVIITDLDPKWAGNVERYGFTNREDAEVWLKEELGSARELGMAVEGRVEKSHG